MENNRFMKPKKGFTEEQKIVMKDIREGYGVEDIAVRHGMPVERARYEVRWLRMFGYLDLMFPDWKASMFGRWHGEQ